MTQFVVVVVEILWCMVVVRGLLQHDSICGAGGGDCGAWWWWCMVVVVHDGGGAWRWWLGCSY